MSQDEFNREMDKYIHKRKDSPAISIKKTAEKRRQDVSRMWQGRKKVSDDIAQFQELEEELEELECEEKELPEEIIEKNKAGVMKRFFNFFRAEKSEDETEEDLIVSNNVLDTEVIDALKMSLKWIEKLPKNQLRQFKQSGDAERFKEVLIKYGIAKTSDKKQE